MRAKCCEIEFWHEFRYNLKSLIDLLVDREVKIDESCEMENVRTKVLFPLNFM
jgi:hypothetical protein